MLLPRCIEEKFLRYVVVGREKIRYERRYIHYGYIHDLSDIKPISIKLPIFFFLFFFLIKRRYPFERRGISR